MSDKKQDQHKFPLDEDVNDLEVAVVGAGSMGAGMVLLFSEHGSRVGVFDTSSAAVQEVLGQAKEDKQVDEKRVHGFSSLEKLAAAFPGGGGKGGEDERTLAEKVLPEALGGKSPNNATSSSSPSALGGSHKPRIFILSLPHGPPIEETKQKLLELCDKGDVVVDAGNEWWERTERRQKTQECREKGIHWVGMGVSGGYQAARHGPSMSPGCSKEAWDVISPYLRKWAAKTHVARSESASAAAKSGGESGGQEHKGSEHNEKVRKEGKHQHETLEPCVEYMGPGGAGHYVKMVHNGIEHAIMSILCEVRSLLFHNLGYSDDEISDLFEKWDKDPNSPLRGTFLIGIGFKALRFHSGDGLSAEALHGQSIVEGIEDKVTQDVEEEEGTGTWSTADSATRHVAFPALAAAHYLRVISADKGLRLKVCDKFEVPQKRQVKAGERPWEKQQQQGGGGKTKKEWEEDLEKAIYGAILAAFVQGLDLIARASEDQEWNVKLSDCIRIWRAGCIIQSDGISHTLLPLLKPFPPSRPLTQLADLPSIASSVSATYQPLKALYMLALEVDAVAPAIGATVEYMKAVGGKGLPTDFEEMELDYFGHHNYDIKSAWAQGAKKGKYHTEFQSTRDMKTE